MTTDKRQLWKAENHLLSLIHIINDLQNESMSIKCYHEKMEKLKKEARLAFQRLAKISHRELSVAERMQFSSDGARQ